MSIKYATYVTNVQEVSKSNYRYKLVINTSNHRNKKAILIMMNPSVANETESDGTTNMVLMSRQYSKFILLNVIPFRGNPVAFTEEHSDYKDIIQNNLNLIKQLITKNPKTDIIFATGNLKHNVGKFDKTEQKCFMSSYHDICQFLKMDKNKSKIKALASPGGSLVHGYARHPSRNAYEIIDVKISINEKSNYTLKTI